MKILALIFALAFSIGQIDQAYVVEIYENEIREVAVTHYAIAKQKERKLSAKANLQKCTEISAPLSAYHYVPVVKDLFIETRTLLL